MLFYILKKNDDSINDDMRMYYSLYPFFVSLLSVLGNKSRSIENVTGIKTASLFKLLTDAVKSNVIQTDTESPTLLCEIFKNDVERKDEFLSNFYCTSLKMCYDEITKADIKSILNQRMDRLDINSLEKLNRDVFVNHPLLLQVLL